jgi:hypothetical protein
MMLFHPDPFVRSCRLMGMVLTGAIVLLMVIGSCRVRSNVAEMQQPTQKASAPIETPLPKYQTTHEEELLRRIEMEIAP